MRYNASLQKGLTILEAIAAQEKGLKLSEIARELGLPSSNTTLFLNTLIHAGYVVKESASGHYCITGKLSELAQLTRVDLYGQLKMVALSEMKRLNQLYNENVLLSILSRHHLSVIQEIASTKPIRIINRPEDLFLPHVTAAGKAILAYQDEKKRKGYLAQCDYPSLTPKSLGSEKKLLTELETIRQEGWASNIGEYDDQVFGVAAPIFSGEEIVASLVVQYPGFRHGQKELGEYAQEVMASAQLISQDISLQMV